MPNMQVSGAGRQGLATNGLKTECNDTGRTALPKKI